uniref:Poly(A) polymerase catalytic subunit domain-containing protein n=1 Tax=viral metagenome TaxID=1070528 RepID=A0A6C0I6L1_9ZZZZ
MKKNICDKNMKFEDCELAILRTAVDKAEERQGRKSANSPEIKQIITIVENFIRQKKLICYGGTAINNILPKQDQFYNKDIEIPDYDFYSADALNDAKELTDIYVKEGFVEVEAKSGQHFGTFKVFVNFIPVADITLLPKELFNAIKKESIKIYGILYAPANLLRMGMYLELSRPAGDVSRWEKVLKRLTLLNKHYPLNASQCTHIDFQRKMGDDEHVDKIYDNVQQTLVDQGVVFFGGYALSIYSQHMPQHFRRQLLKIPDFDVLSEEPTVTAHIIKERLNDIDVKNVKIIKRPSIGEIIAPHYEIRVGKDTVAFIYEPLACHSYNIIKESGYDVKVATIDTMLSFYLAFLYANRPYYDKNRILCMSKYLFEVQEKNRLAQKGVLRRFSINCMGHQETIEEMRAEKAEKFKELKDKKKTPEYEEWFLRYRPTDGKKDTIETNEKEDKTSSPKNKSKRPHALKKKAKTKKKKGFFF